MTLASTVMALLVLVLVMPASSQGPPPPDDRDASKVCQDYSSRAACDPRTGYIAGRPGAPCSNADLACVQTEWREIGQPETTWAGACGANHEDGGTLVSCPVEVTLPDGSTQFVITSPDGTEQVVQPPSHAEAVVVCADPPAPSIGYDPDTRGVTGMETRLRASAQRATRTTGWVRGFPVECNVTPEQWTWGSGDGRTFVRDRHGGPHPDNPVAYVYETKGSYTLTLAVRWRRTTTFGSDTLTRSARQPYQVIEVRSVITDTG